MRNRLTAIDKADWIPLFFRENSKTIELSMFLFIYERNVRCFI